MYEHSAEEYRFSQSKYNHLATHAFSITHAPQLAATAAITFM